MVVVLTIDHVDYDNYKTYGALDYDDAIEVVEEVLGLNHNEIKGFQRVGVYSQVRKVNFAISEVSFEDKNIRDKMYQRIRISSQKVVVVSVPGREITEVFVRHAPFDWEDEKFNRIFSYYGDIKQLEHLTIRQSETRSREYVGKRNGITKIRMEIKKNIPSLINIDRQRIEIYYRNQRRTCFRCGQPCGGDHIFRNCKTKPDEFENNFTMEQFPALPVVTRPTDSARKQDIRMGQIERPEEEDQNVENQDDINNGESINVEDTTMNDETSDDNELNRNNNAEVLEAVAEASNKNSVQEINGETIVNKESEELVMVENQGDSLEEQRNNATVNLISEDATIQVHRESEETITASEGERDIITPGQIINITFRNEDEDDIDVEFCDAADNIELIDSISEAGPAFMDQIHTQEIKENASGTAEHASGSEEHALESTEHAKGSAENVIEHVLESVEHVQQSAENTLWSAEIDMETD